MTITKLLPLALAAHALAFAVPGQEPDQVPLGAAPVSSGFQCDLPPALAPGHDGLPSASELFSSDEALAKQVERHQALVRVPSICFDDLGDFDEDDRWETFYELHQVLAETYPKVHKRSKLEKVNTFGLVYTIEGSDPSLKPTLLTGHQDVVPVPDPSTWTHPPFEAVFDGEWLWGRGSVDDKNSVTAVFSALETLLSDKHWQPRRTIILAFGFDEECSGFRGAGAISEHLTDRYGDDSIAVLLDEGGLGQHRIGNVVYAFPGVTEKGHLDVWFDLALQGGHSSLPFPHTGIGIVAELITALEQQPFEAKLIEDSPVYNALVCQARYSPEDQPEIADMLERDDLEGIAARLVDQSRVSNFMIQTSQSVDIISGGAKINAMPEIVTFGVNHRIAPQDSVAKVQHSVVERIANVVSKYNITLKAFEGDEEYHEFVNSSMPTSEDILPMYSVDYNATLTLSAKQVFQVSPVSPTSGPVWDIFSGTIQHTFASEDGLVVPVGHTMSGNTDTRHYLNLTPNIYRWSPVPEGGGLNIHTVNERVRMDAHMEMVKFYYNFVRNFDAADF